MSDLSGLETEAIGAAETLGTDALHSVEADLPGWEADLKAKVEQLVYNHPVIQHLIADLRRYGIPVPALTDHLATTGQTLPEATPDAPAPDDAAPAAPAA